MSESVWLESADQPESLALCVRSVLAGRGIERTYEEIVAALGLGSLLAIDAEQPAAAWCGLGRDAFLASGLALFNVRIRELHPPPAARRLERSPEFSDHFRDSYLPLIARAMEHGQPVLAWRGWAPPAEQQWGLLTSVATDAARGLCPGCDGRPQVLGGPAQQVYVIETPEQAGSPRDARHVLAAARRAALATWHSDIPGRPDLLTGERAFGAWCESVAALTRAADSEQVAAAKVHGHQAWCVSLARRALAVWLDELDPAAVAIPGALLAGWAHAAGDAAHALNVGAPAAFAERVRREGPRAWQDLAQRISAAEAADERAVQLIESDWPDAVGGRA